MAPTTSATIETPGGARNEGSALVSVSSFAVIDALLICRVLERLYAYRVMSGKCVSHPYPHACTTRPIVTSA